MPFLCGVSCILITGGSGLIGTALTRALLAEGHQVRHLSRSPGPDEQVTIFHWDIRAGTVDPRALHGVDHIVHLAGAPIAGKRWTPDRVKELIASRADSSRLLQRYAEREGIVPKSFISAAGIGYYGATTSDGHLKESDPPGNDTIARISVAWEKAVDEWTAVTRVVKLRTPIVLACNGGALPTLSGTARWGLGTSFGNGRQWFPWVHIDDLVRTYEYALANEALLGAYNVCASDQRNNAEFMVMVAKVLGKPFFLPSVPAFLLELALGEVARTLLNGTRISSKKLRNSGFTFRFDELEIALRDLLE